MILADDQPSGRPKDANGFSVGAAQVRNPYRYMTPSIRDVVLLIAQSRQVNNVRSYKVHLKAEFRSTAACNLELLL
jgi:hypothetical protein